jgi:hypothetical protein
LQAGEFYCRWGELRVRFFGLPPRLVPAAGRGMLGVARREGRPMALMWRGWRRDLGAGFIGAAVVGAAVCGLGYWKDAVFAAKLLQITQKKSRK